MVTLRGALECSTFVVLRREVFDLLVRLRCSFSFRALHSPGLPGRIKEHQKESCAGVEGCTKRLLKVSQCRFNCTGICPSYHARPSPRNNYD